MCGCGYVLMREWTQASLDACTIVGLNLCVHVCMRVCMCVCMQVDVYASVDVQGYIYDVPNNINSSIPELRNSLNP